MAELWIVVWFTNNWQIILSVAIIMGIILCYAKFNDSFDANPIISPQEEIRSYFFGIIVFLGLVTVVSLIVSYFI